MDSSPFNETVRILERWTAAHWGRDCFVWVVHYPRELIEPWSQAEAIKSGMTDSERESYKRKFIADLQLDNSETFLISIYSFGTSPVNISPVEDNISLLTSSGTRIKPSKYDTSLNYPSNGVVQGLVFFPRQSDKNFSIALKGMGVYDERIFSFEPPEYVPPPPQKPQKPEVVVVNLPPKKSPPKPTPPPPPPPPVIPPRPITPIFQEDSSDMSDFVNSVRNKSNDVRNSQNNRTRPNNQRNTQNNIDNAYVSRESVLRKFLSLWANGKASEMYDMLSDQSKNIISRENFSKEIAKSSDFKSGLKSDYTIDWVGNERAKVTVEKKLLMFRSLSSRTFTLVRESSAWKIIWL